jgi:hypothetical protein
VVLGFELRASCLGTTWAMPPAIEAEFITEENLTDCYLVGTTKYFFKWSLQTTIVNNKWILFLFSEI